MIERKEKCSRCRKVCDSCHEVPNMGYWDEVAYEYSDSGFARFCDDCYEQTRQELADRWESEYRNDERYYNDNPYEGDRDGN